MMETFMYVLLNYSNKNNHIERISVATKNKEHILPMASEIIGSDQLYLFLLSHGTWIDDNT